MCIERGESMFGGGVFASSDSKGAAQEEAESIAP